MKKLLCILSIGLLAITSCTKKSSTTTPTPTPTTPVAGFKWVVNGVDTTTADSAYFETAYNTIKAYKGGIAKFIEVNLTAGTAATYTVGGGNAVSYLVGTGLYTASAGSVIISANASSKMTGSFTSTGSGASVTSLSATFTDITVK